MVTTVVITDTGGINSMKITGFIMSIVVALSGLGVLYLGLIITGEVSTMPMTTEAWIMLVLVLGALIFIAGMSFVCAYEMLKDVFTPVPKPVTYNEFALAVERAKQDAEYKATYGEDMPK